MVGARFGTKVKITVVQADMGEDCELDSLQVYDSSDDVLAYPGLSSQCGEDEFPPSYEKIISDCNCMPSFHQLAHKDVSEICTGPGLTCMNKILRFIGKLNRVNSHHHERL